MCLGSGGAVFHVDQAVPQLGFLAAQMEGKYLVWVPEDRFLWETKTLTESSISSISRTPSRGLGPANQTGCVLEGLMTT